MLNFSFFSAGIFFTILVIERLGRKKTMALEFLIFVVSVIFLFICTSDRTWLTFILFIARGIISGVFQAAYVYTPEVREQGRAAVYEMLLPISRWRVR